MGISNPELRIPAKQISQDKCATAIVHNACVITDRTPQAVSWIDRDEAIVRGQYQLSVTAEPGEYLLGAIADDISLVVKGHPFSSAAWIDFSVLTQEFIPPRLFTTRAVVFDVPSAR